MLSPEVIAALLPFKEKGLFESQDDAQLAELSGALVEEVSEYRVEHAPETVPPPADVPPEVPKPDAEEAIKGADGKAEAAPKTEAKLPKKAAPKRAPKAPAKKPAAKAPAKKPAAKAAPKKPASEAKPAEKTGAVRITKASRVKNADGRPWRLGFRDIYTGADATFLRENYPDVVEDYPRPPLGV